MNGCMYRPPCPNLASGLKLQGFGAFDFWVSGLAAFRVWGFRVWGLRFKASELGFGVRGVRTTLKRAQARTSGALNDGLKPASRKARKAMTTSSRMFGGGNHENCKTQGLQSPK